MSFFQMHLVLDDEGPVRAGDSIRGRLVVLAQKELHCRPLTLRLLWRTSGPGNNDEGGPSFVLFEGVLPPGEHSFPFDVQTPPGGPFTQAGRLVSVGWVLRAQVHIGVTFAPSVERQVVVLPRERRDGEEPFVPPLRYQHDAGGRQRHYAPSVGLKGIEGAVLSFAAPGALLSLLLLLGLIYESSTHPPGVPLLAGVSSVLLVSLAALAWVVRAARDRRLFGELRLTPVPTVVARGQTLRTAVELCPRRALDLRGIRLRLRCTEHRIVRYTGRANLKSVVHHGEEVEALAPRRIEAGSPFRGELAIQIPDDALLSFQSDSHFIEWELCVRVDVRRGPDGRITVPLQVIP